jgi:hypothetical protein
MIYPAKGQHNHNQRLSGPDIAQDIAEIVSGSDRPDVIEGNHHGTHDDAEENIGAQPGQVGPTIDYLSSIGRARHFKIETQHVITPL